MDYLAPPLTLCLHLRLDLELGMSPLESLRRFVATDNRELSNQVRRLLILKDQDNLDRFFDVRIKSMYQIALFELAISALRGEPILNHLKELEVELSRACEADIDKFIAALPLKTLLPLMLLQFPAFLLLLFGPILNEFTKGLSL